jgi:hypothetical protein
MSAKGADPLRSRFPGERRFFGIAVIRYDGDKTFTELQEELKKDEHIASVERNASVRLSAGAALVFALNPQNWDAAGAPGWTPHDIAQHQKASAKTIQGLRLACIHGKRLNLRRAVYGPLRITTPAAGATFTAGVPNNITWTLRYNNPRFTRVKIEFSTTGNPPYTLLSPPAGSPIGAPFMWTPTAADKTPNGRIRITPIEGNFPRRSRLFKVV